jgi:hypothetical protein
MSLDTHVQVTLSVNNAGVALAGFGLIGVLTYKNVFPERRRLYNRLADVIADGFAADSPEAIAASRIFGQSPHPMQLMLIRGDLAPTQRYLVEAIDVRNSYPYRIGVIGEGVTATEVEYESDAAASVAEIHNGLVTGLNAVVGKNFTAAFAPATALAGTFTATNATETFTKNAHGFQTGDGPYQLTNAGGALPTGLAPLTDYFVIRVDANTFRLATSRANAFANTYVLIADDGTGVHTITPNAATSPALPFTVTGDAPGEWFSLEMLDRSILSASQDHADPGIATDLAAIQTEDSSWYYLHTLFNSDAMVLAAANWVEANGKMYYPDVSNTECENTASGNSEIGDDLLALELKRTVPVYHSRPAAMAGAALMGRLAPLNPGKWTAAYKTLSGVPVMTFSATQMANLDARKMTYYKREAGRSITWEGKVGNAMFGFADVTTALDWFLDRLQKRIFGVFVAKNKVAYTDEDIAEIKGAAEGVVIEGMSDAYTIIAPGTPGDPDDPVPTVTFPRVRDIDPSLRALRQLPDCAISFRLQGATHSVIVDVTVSF